MKKILANKKIFSVLKLFILLVVGIIIFFSFCPLEKNVKIPESAAGKIKLKVGDKVTSTINIKGEKLSGLIFYSKSEVDNIELVVTVKNDSEITYERGFDKLNKKNNLIVFDKTLEDIETLDLEFYLKKSNNQISLKKNESGQLVIDQVIKQNDYSVLPWLYILFAIGLFIILKEKLKSKTKNATIKNKIIKYTIYLMFVMITVIFSVYTAACAVYQKTLDFYQPILMLSLISICIYLSLSLLKDKKDLADLFLIISIPIASFYCVYCMPEEAPDEYRHYIRAYDTVKGNLIVDKHTYIPSQILASSAGFKTVENLFKTVLEKTDYSDEIEIYNTASGYNPILYVFPSLAISITKLLNINMYLGWYLGKAFNMLFFLIIGYFTVKKMPKFKMLTILYLLIPTNVRLCTSVSCDALINMCSIYLMAHILSLAENKKHAKFKDYLLLIILGIISTIAKPIYLPITIGMLIIARKQFYSKKTKYLKPIISLSIIFLAYIIWLMVNTTPNLIETENIGVGSLGLSYSFLHPLSTIKVIFDFIINKPDVWLLETIGTRFLWSSSSVYVPMVYPAIYFILLLAASIYRDDKIDYSLSHKIVFGLVALISFGGTVLALHTQEIRSNLLTDTLWGVQGRYFIPINILFFLCINKQKIINNIQQKYNMIICSAIILHILYIIQLLNMALY